MKRPAQPLRHKVFSEWRYFIGFGFGTGLLPTMPGTWGTLAAIPLAYLLSILPIAIHFLCVLAYFFLAAKISETLSQQLGIHDYTAVNCDEIVGFLCVMLPFKYNLENLFLGFILFRAYDILKPFPICWIDRHIRNGYGMILDDVAAALMTIASMYIIQQCRL